MSIFDVPAHKVMLPGTPHGLFVRGELHDFLHLPDDGTRVEIIGGEVVVSPVPALGHAGMVQDISDLVAMARIGRQGFPWRCIQVTGLNLIGVEDGYIPDLMVLDVEAFDAAGRANVICLVPDEVELAVEVTSRRNAFRDRAPSGDDKIGKWCGYAQAEIPYYLLIDRDPQVARAVLYSIPDASTGAYLHVGLLERRTGHLLIFERRDDHAAVVMDPALQEKVDSGLRQTGDPMVHSEVIGADQIWLRRTRLGSVLRTALPAGAPAMASC